MSTLLLLNSPVKNHPTWVIFSTHNREETLRRAISNLPTPAPAEKCRGTVDCRELNSFTSGHLGRMQARGVRIRDAHPPTLPPPPPPPHIIHNFSGPTFISFDTLSYYTKGWPPRRGPDAFHGSFIHQETASRPSSSVIALRTTDCSWEILLISVAFSVAGAISLFCLATSLY